MTRDPAFGAAAARTAAATVRAAAGPVTPRVALVLGSGLGALAGVVTVSGSLAYEDVPGFPPVAVHGHAGRLICGTLEDVAVVVFAGRFHGYEGHAAALTAFPVRVAHALGASTLIVSNAAGGINPAFQGGDLMVISDHLNLMGTSPLTGHAEPGDERFPDMSAAYDPTLRAALHGVAAAQDVTLREGVYAALPGPSYETPAEVRMLRTLGADAVGMSTVPEVIVARAVGMRVAGISCITNMAAGIQLTPLAHEEVLETTARVAARFQALVRGLVATLRA